MLCAIMKICRGFGLLEPSSLLETRYLVFVFLQLVSCFLLFGMCQWISHSLRYLLIDILQVIVFRLVSYYHLIPCLLVYYQLCVELILESLEHAYLLYIASFACFLSLTQYIGETPPCHKLAKVCMKFKFISICTYVCGVCPMYCWFSNSLVPMSLGTILFVLLFQEQLEMHWMLGSPIRKMLRPCDYWSQVRMIKEQLSTTSIQCCLGNKYPLHAFFSCKGPNLSFLFQVASWHESLDSFL